MVSPVETSSPYNMMNVVVLPLPLLGHLNPCLSVARLLASKGFIFTFVVTEELAAAKVLQQATSEGSSPIHYATVASSNDGPRAAGLSALSASLSIMHSMRPGVEDLLRKMAFSAQRVSCIIADSSVTWSQQVATLFNIPRFVFYTSNAYAFALALHSPSLISQGLLPIQDPELLIDSIPGLPPLRARDLPQSIQTLPEFVVAQMIDIHEAAGVILNTVYEFESKPLEVIRDKLPVYPIGPLLLMPGSDSKATLGLWPEERSCLNWLDTMLPSSVLYVSFGSIASMSVDQMRELAEGLDASGHAFLWVLRPNAAEGPLSRPPEMLPEAFEERTRERGLIITWAPQVEVLSHPAVGGFLTHCGWNSITENLSRGGVPMICWPHISEQRLNARLLVDKLKVGLELEEEGGSMVKRGVVEKAVKELMEGDMGRELRRRALELKEAASLAVQEGGSSHHYLEALVQDMKRFAQGPYIS